VSAPVDYRAQWRRALLRSDLPQHERLVGVAFLEYVNKASHEAWVGVPTLSHGGANGRAHTGISERRVRDALHRLVAEAWLAEVKQRPGSTTLYRINPLHVVQAPLHVVQGTPAAGAGEVDLEVEREEISGAVQLNFEQERAEEYARAVITEMKAVSW